MDDALLGIESNLKVGGDWNEAKHGNLMQWSKASREFDETRLFINVVGAKGTREAFDNVGRIANVVAAGISKKDAQVYDNSREEFFKAVAIARSAVRRELGIDKFD